MSKRDNIRQKIFSGKQTFKTEIIDFFGEKVEVRQPSVGQILELRESEDRKKALVRMMVNYCFVPGTEEKVFQPTDEDEIMKLPVGGWFENLNNAIVKLTNIDIGSAEKNSETATSDSSSTT